MDRRKFISKIGLIGSLGFMASYKSTFAEGLEKPELSLKSAVTGANGSVFNQQISHISDTQNTESVVGFKEMIKPKALSIGDTIAITAPASPTSLGEISPTVRLLKSLGYNVVIGNTILKQTISNRYLSDEDQVRAAELMDFIKNDKISAIVCGRGGYGVMRTFPYLDFSEFGKNPKIIIGFSDITALLIAINKEANLVCFHGPVATYSFDSYTLTSFKEVLTDEKQFQKIENIVPEMIVVNPGKSVGRLVGGNLKLIISTMGTPYEIDTKDSILFLEEVNEHPYEIDRMLTQLVISGKLNRVKAIVFGKFAGANVRKPFHPFASFTINEILEQLIKPYNIPVVYNVPFGHTDRMLTLPLGINVELDTEKKTISYLEPAVTLS